MRIDVCNYFCCEHLRIVNNDKNAIAKKILIMDQDNCRLIWSELVVEA